MAELKEDNEPYDEINVVPMLDVAYVLLVIFIIMTTASVQGIMINLPQASATPSLAKPKTKAVTIDANGQIFLNTYPVTLSELEERLRAYKAAIPDLPVVIRGDEALPYGKVIEVMDLCGRLGITQLGLVTAKIVK